MSDTFMLNWVILLVLGLGYMGFAWWFYHDKPNTKFGGG